MARLSRIVNPTRNYKYVLNWGNSGTVNTRARILNPPEKIAVAVNKLAAFEAMKAAGVPVPEFTTKPPHFNKKSDIWFARTHLRASGGEGIKVIRSGDSIPEAPLYVKYIKKNREFRVHVVNGEVIFCQEKKRESSAEQSSDQKLIRNYDNGWVFCLVPTSPPEGVTDAAVACVTGLGLDFGAVDIVVDRDSGKPFVLECNTAPGLQSPSVIKAYKEAFTQWLNPTNTGNSGSLSG